MGYYHIPLDEESQKLCTTVFPWGLYQYTRLPMGISNAPDIFQGIILDLFKDMDNVNAYLDDILLTSKGTYEEHLEYLNQILERLNTAGFAVNVRKSFFAVADVEYLGYQLT